MITVFYNFLIKLKKKIFKNEEHKACPFDKNFVVVHINNS
jgi:hypothetical protein